MVLGVRGLWNIISGDEAQLNETTHPIESEEWLSKDREAHAQITLTLKDEPLSGVLYTTTSAEAWRKLRERYKGKGKQSIAYLISELFCSTLLDDKSMETQLNSMRQKANVLKTLGQPLEDSLIAIAMVISLPPSYSTLRTILMAANDKLTMDTVINQVLIEEKSRKVSSAHMALAAKTTGQPKGKGKGKGDKEDKGKKTCTYCSKNGLLRPCPTLGLIRLLWSHRSSAAQLQSLTTYSGRTHADTLPLSTPLGLSSIRSLPHLAVYPVLT